MTDIGYSDFRTQIMTIKELVDMWQCYGNESRESITYNITSVQRSRYIEAVLIGMPLQSVYVDDTSGEWLYVSGGERIKAYVEYCLNLYPLKSLYFKQEVYGERFFSELSNLAKQKILSTQIQVHVLNPGLSKQERFGIYVCLKPRLDANTFKSCRRRIFPELYSIVEDIAKDVVQGNFILNRRKSNIEYEICHLLVFIWFNEINDEEPNANMDLLANIFLEDIRNQSFMFKMKRRIISTLIETREVRSIMRYGHIAQDLFNAVRFFMSERIIDENTFIEAYQYTLSENIELTDDFASLSHRLENILHYLRQNNYDR